LESEEMRSSGVSDRRLMPEEVLNNKKEYLFYLQHFSRYNFVKSYVNVALRV